MILPDHEIRRRCISEHMIQGWAPHTSTPGTISYGIGSFGYDARLAPSFRVFQNAEGVRAMAEENITAVIDPKRFDPRLCYEHEGEICCIPPHGFVLGHTIERFKIPRDVLVICLGKSTYARCGLIVNVTPLEPEWEGQVTIEISNTTPLPALVYANEGICQFVFLEGRDDPVTSYADRQGKYQGQLGVTLPRMPTGA